jgi:predicted permease
MYSVFITIVPFFLVLFIGYCFAKFKLVEPDWTRILNLFALRVAFPALIFSSLAKSEIIFQDQKILILVNSLYVFACFGLAIIVSKIFRLPEKIKLTLFIVFPFGNIAYLGMPLVNEIYGGKSVTPVSIILGIYLFWIFTLGIYYLEMKKDKKRPIKAVVINLVKNPLLIGVLAGIIASFIGISKQNVLLKSTEMIARSATPVVLFSIGIFISQIKIGTIREWGGIGLFTIAKLLILPFLLYIFLVQFKLIQLPYQLSVIEASMPLALTPYALSQEYDMDAGFIAKSILLTTILSVLIIPFWVVFLA